MTGDILSATVDATGWRLAIAFEGLSTGGTYALGLTGNNDPTAARIVLRVQSPGYADDGTLTTITRTVYGTKQIRKPYPNQASIDETVSGSDVICQIALSDYVHSGDTILSTSIAAGVYTQGGNASLAGTPTTTNSSAQGYARCIANWSWPGFERVTGPFTVRAVGFHRSGQQGRPLRAMKFTVTDGTTTRSTFVLNPTIDRTRGDLVPVIEYIGGFDAADFADNVELTCNFIAYPWVGNATSLLDSSDGVNTGPSNNYAPIKLLNDPDNDYGVTVAVVSASGNDSTGAVVDSAAFDPGTPPAAYLTINKAASAIAAYNNANRSRNDNGAGIIYLQAGNHAWTGASNSVGTAPKTWLTVTMFPGLTSRTSCVISGAPSGMGFPSKLTKLVNVSISSSSAYLIYYMDALWVDDCLLNSTGEAPISDNKVGFITRSELLAYGSALRMNQAGCRFALLRGSDLSGTKPIEVVMVLVGNRKTTVNTGTAEHLILESPWSVAINPYPQNAIVAYNLFFGCSAYGSSFLALHNHSATIVMANFVGTAVVQNVIEVTGMGSGGLTTIAGGLIQDIDNVLLWNNTFLGERVIAAYNDAGSVAFYRKNWSYQGNNFDDDNIKSDTFFPFDGNRVGNWALLFGVGRSGNFGGNVGGIGAAGFLCDFPGLHSFETGSALDIGYQAFVDRKAASSAVDGAGNGNYRLKSNSPLIPWVSPWVLPFDIEGNARGISDPPGAYASANPRKGGMF